MKSMIYRVGKTIYFERYSMKIVKYVIIFILFFIASIFLVNFYVLQDSKDTIYTSIESLPKNKV